LTGSKRELAEKLLGIVMQRAEEMAGKVALIQSLYSQ